MAKLGRPSKYTDKLAAEICTRLAGGASLKDICKDAHMPSRITVYDWLLKHETFPNLYARAREAQADYYADEIVRIADDSDDYNKARVRIDARKWFACKMNKKSWGDKQALELSDPDGNALVPVINVTVSR